MSLLKFYTRISYNDLNLEAIGKSTTALSSTEASFACDYTKYKTILIELCQWKNIWSQCLVGTSYFRVTNTASRVQITHNISNTTWVFNVYTKGSNNTIYVSASGGTGLGTEVYIRIRGVAKANL